MSERDMNQQELAAGWDKIAVKMELYPSFYAFVADAPAIVGLPTDASIADVGCGTGRLLSVLVERGYSRLTGVDFSSEATSITQQRLPAIQTYVHNIVEAPLASPFQSIFMTEVIEHLTDPYAALRHLYQSLEPGGYLFLSFPNRSAYGPLLYLRWLRHLVRWSPWLTHWIKRTTMPYEMRSEQPLDHAYTPGDIKRFIAASGLEVVRQRGMRLLPMFRIPGIDITERVVAWLERQAQKTPIQIWYYRMMFICQKPR